MRSAREHAGLSQEEVARGLSLTAVGYGHYERGRTPFTIEQVFALSRILGRSVPWLLGIDNGLTDLEDEVLTLFRAVPDNFKLFVIEQVRVFVPKPPTAGNDDRSGE